MLDTLAILAALLVLLGAPAVGVLIAVDAPRRQAARRAVAHVITARPPAIAITDARTGTDHLVTDAAAARDRSSGRYLAACGARVLAASLTAPAAGTCRFCLTSRCPLERHPLTNTLSGAPTVSWLPAGVTTPSSGAFLDSSFTGRARDVASRNRAPAGSSGVASYNAAIA